MINIPNTEQSKQQEWKVILTIARNNGFPAHIIHDLKKKLITKKQKHDITTQQNKKCVTFTYHSPLIRKITNLFKQTNLNITFGATNTVQQQLTEKPAHKNPSGIYKLKCNTCNNAYMGSQKDP
jgi:K+ transporter